MGLLVTIAVHGQSVSTGLSLSGTTCPQQMGKPEVSLTDSRILPGELVLHCECYVNGLMLYCSKAL